MGTKALYFSIDVLLWSSIAVAILGAIRWRKLVLSLRIFVLVKFVSVSCDVGGRILLANKIIPNHTSTLYKITELILLLLMYSVLFNNKKLKLPLRLITLTLTVFGVVNWLYVQKSEINSYTDVIDSVALLVVSLYFFFWYSARPQSNNSTFKALFWINTGIVIYLSATLLLFMVTEYLIKMVNDTLITYWTYHNIMAILANLFFFYGLWIAGRNKPEAPTTGSY